MPTSRRTVHDIALSGATISLMATFVSLLAMVIPADTYSRVRGMASDLVLAIVILMGVLAVVSMGLSAALTNEGNKADNQMTHKERSMTDAAVVFCAIALVAFVALVVMENLEMDARQYVWAIVVFAGATAVGGGLMAAVTSNTQSLPAIAPSKSN